jgi:hypothetical protein
MRKEVQSSKFRARLTGRAGSKFKVQKFVGLSDRISFSKSK